jgi:hypothetical protein
MLSPTPVRTGEPSRSTLQTFWTTFRAAFMARNAARVAGLAKVPLSVRALPAGDPVYELDRAATVAFLPAVFEEPTSSAASDGKPEPLLALVRRTKDLAPSEDDASFAKLDNLEFEFVSHLWRLSRIYSRHRP